ncbi:MAG: hypothetical protein CMK59_04785 [Proteobacteria bacterium]|nr:hypothetical protein [Pseudomonadota bacterium]
MSIFRRLKSLSAELKQRHLNEEFGLQYAKFYYDDEDTRDSDDLGNDFVELEIEFMWRNGVHKQSEAQKLKDLQTLVRSYLNFEVSALTPLVNNEQLLGHLPFLIKDYTPDVFPLFAKILHEKVEDHFNSFQQWEDLLDKLEKNADVRHNALRDSASSNHKSNDILWDFASDTHIGAKKSFSSQTNQDSFFYDSYKNTAIIMVADGISVSNAGSGDQASFIAKQVTAHIWELNKDNLLSANPDDIKQFLLQVLLHANHNICDVSASSVEDISKATPMGTTILLGYVRDSELWLSHLGDSRGYIINEDGLCLITGDHNLRGEKLRHGLSVDLLDNQPALIRYLGHFDEKMNPALHVPDICHVPLLEGERILLCSDGLTDYASPTHADFNELATTISSNASYLHEICWQLTIFANIGGGGDNITTIVAEFKEDNTSE